MKKRTTGAAEQRLGVELILFDFDGVLTDNRVWVNQDGSESVCCNRADGLGFSLLQEAGIQCMIVSTETNPVVAERARKLGVPIIQSVADKGDAVMKICRDRNIAPAKVAFVGNDLNDLPALRVVGKRLCPCDASLEVRRICHPVLRTRGGAGVVREIAVRLKRLFR